MDNLPTIEEIEKATRLLSSGKTPGSDSIPAEIYKEGGSALLEKLHQLFTLTWQEETLPQDFKDASIIHLYKRKGNRQACDTHRGISLLSIAGKVPATSSWPSKPKNSTSIFRLPDSGTLCDIMKLAL